MNRDVLRQGVLFALQEPKRVANPYPLYHQLRSEAPFHWDFVLSGWFLTRYADVREALSDPRLSTRNFPFDVGQLPPDLQEELAPLGCIIKREVLYNDAPEHDRLRRPLNRAFNPAIFGQLRPKLEAAADELLANAERRRAMDVVSEYSEPFADCMIGELLGLPGHCRPEFIKHCELVRKFMLAKRIGRQTALMAKAAAQATRRIRRWIRPMIAARQATLVDDLIGYSLAVNGNETPFTEDEILANCVFFLNAGARNMSAALTNAFVTLLQHPKQFSHLRENPGSISASVEELLRYETPVHIAIRGAREQMELGGRQIGQDHLLVLLLGAANRDPDQFAEPDRLDLERRPNPHVSFGMGSHGCVGAWMSRFAIAIAIEAILARQTAFQLATRKLDWSPSPIRRTVRSLPVLVDRRTHTRFPRGSSARRTIPVRARTTAWH